MAAVACGPEAFEGFGGVLANIIIDKDAQRLAFEKLLNDIGLCTFPGTLWDAVDLDALNPMTG